MKGPKGFKDDEVGGRESMKKHYREGYNMKPFNENLNPLYGWLRSIIGKKWDKCYSEMCKKFDMRGVINAHILQHLYQDLEVNTFIGDNGQVMCLSERYLSRGEVPIKQCHKDYYVCPKDGTVKKTHKAPRRSVIKQREADALKAKLAVFRDLGNGEVLHLIDGVWYHFVLKPIPLVKVEYIKPLGENVFKIGYAHIGQQKEKTWDELNQAERERFGRPHVLGGTARDEFTDEVVYRTEQRTFRRKIGVHSANHVYNDASMYHSSKSSASHKQLKQAGIV